MITSPDNESYRSGLVFLRRNDEIFNNLYDELGLLEQRKRPVSFSYFVSTIIGQQLSGSAADTIYKRLLQKVNNQLTYEKVRALSLSDLRELGISKAKGTYISELANQCSEGALNIEQLSTLDDNDLFNELIKIKGIGPWSAKIIMLFNFQRLDAFPFGDATLEKAFQLIWKKDLESLSGYVGNWSPYSGIVAMYMWSFIDKN